MEAYAPFALAIALALGPALPGRAAGLPPTVAAELPALAAAERSLQDATLELQAARREAEPAQKAADAARGGDGLWARWWLRRKLADLKAKLDAVESARQARARSRQAEFTVLSGLEEELRGSLESGLGEVPPAKGDWAAWWRQKQEWTRRVEALEAATEETEGAPDAGALLTEVRLAQIARDRRIVAILKEKGVLAPLEAQSQIRELDRSRTWWGSRLVGRPARSCQGCPK